MPKKRVHYDLPGGRSGVACGYSRYAQDDYSSSSDQRAVSCIPCLSLIPIKATARTKRVDLPVPYETAKRLWRCGHCGHELYPFHDQTYCDFAFGKAVPQRSCRCRSFTRGQYVTDQVHAECSAPVTPTNSHV